MDHLKHMKVPQTNVQEVSRLGSQRISELDDYLTNRAKIAKEWLMCAKYLHSPILPQSPDLIEAEEPRLADP
ncbi:hypothetical protein TNCV_4506641 [Trichonephila clavipes]|nr:hypothetical protein TNCV_4506641 [Trichonephila clavipes]